MLYVYDSTQLVAVREDLALTRKHVMVDALPLSAADFPSCLGLVAQHNLLLVPTDLAHHTGAVERIKRIATLAGIRFESISVWYRRTQANNVNGRPAAGHAVSPDWHAPVAGGQTLTHH